MRGDAAFRLGAYLSIMLYMRLQLPIAAGAIALTALGLSACSSAAGTEIPATIQADVGIRPANVSCTVDGGVVTATGSVVGPGVVRLVLVALDARGAPVGADAEAPRRVASGTTWNWTTTVNTPGASARECVVEYGPSIGAIAG
jgi:hypothetical protein